MALEPLKHLFNDLILEDQDCFAHEEGWETLLQLIPDSDVVERLRAKWEGKSGLSSEVKWDDLKIQARAEQGKETPW